jgi:hypothetical protein
MHIFFMRIRDSASGKRAMFSSPGMGKIVDAVFKGLGMLFAGNRLKTFFQSGG